MMSLVFAFEAAKLYGLYKFFSNMQKVLLVNKK